MSDNIKKLEKVLDTLSNLYEDAAEVDSDSASAISVAEDTVINAIKFLNEKYAEYGFVFEVDEDFKDRVLVTSTHNEEGKREQTQEYFTFDQGFIFDDDDANSAEAKRMDDWMRGRAFKTENTKTLQNIFTIIVWE